MSAGGLSLLIIRSPSGSAVRPFRMPPGTEPERQGTDKPITTMAVHRANFILGIFII
jgi:hypothetical protein